LKYINKYKYIILFCLIYFSIQNLLANQLEERQQDRETLRTLLNNLGKLRQDMTNINYLDL